MSEQQRILAVFAHPDDECYGPGGTIARYAQADVAISLLMFTCGEAGSIGVSREMAPDDLCRVRTLELANACRVLGIKEHRVLGVPDGKVSASDTGRALAEIRRDIERYQPQILLTFHYRGVSGHPDHVTVSELVARAFEESSTVQKLYEWGIPEEKSRLYERPNLKPMRPDEVTTRIDVPPDAMERKIEAIACHVTQSDFFKSLDAKFDYRRASTPECFYLRATRRARPLAVETDFFHDL